MDQQPSTNRDAAIARNRFWTRITGWSVIFLIVASAGLVVWHDFKNLGAWNLLPVGVAIVAGLLAYKQAATAKRR